MKITTLLCLLILGLSSCEWGNLPKKETHPIFTDTLTYSYKAINERAADCGNRPDSACTILKIKYPEFKGRTILNDTVKNKLLTLFMLSEKRDTSLDALAKRFINDYMDFKRSNPETKLFYELDAYAKVIRQDSALITLEYGGYNFQGGAHGASFTGFINWNFKANKKIFLKDILSEGYETPLTKIAEGLFRKDEKLNDSESLAPNYFFKDAKFSLNENYAITPLGIKFIYNQYEIKPYAAGQTELFIPYKAIKTLIKPGSVLTQFITKNAGI